MPYSPTSVARRRAKWVNHGNESFCQNLRSSFEPQRFLRHRDMAHIPAMYPCRPILLNCTRRICDTITQRCYPYLMSIKTWHEDIAMAHCWSGPAGSLVVHRSTLQTCLFTNELRLYIQSTRYKVLSALFEAYDQRATSGSYHRHDSEAKWNKFSFDLYALHLDM